MDLGWISHGFAGALMGTDGHCLEFGALMASDEGTDNHGWAASAGVA
jgi:hypothetical protein